MKANQWTVRAVRTLHGQEFAVYELGPYRFKLWARVVAWLETSDGPVWQQYCAIVVTAPSAHRAAPSTGHEGWLRASA
ncbi:hypothetical protein [Pseudorhodoferax sp. Leaf267]|uniref:hypothetical protein n=1 Tax=Pseudorhodoferax sp. Leaf267 TaxID=1736316 RepID=UPI0012E0F22E|nr:hypothetical protein [Pseudorhodoferax sp. Leaf267]